LVRYDARAGERSLDVMRWGLVPFWAKDLKVGFANINAKAEGIENLPAFVRRSSGAAAWCRSITFTSGRPRGASNPTRSRLPTAG
jgi:putative SOS response-associated peptidase YedK